MIHLTYENLDHSTQQHLIERAKREIEWEHGSSLKQYAAEQKIEYDAVLEEEAIRKLYTYQFQFSI